VALTLGSIKWRLVTTSRSVRLAAAAAGVTTTTTTTTTTMKTTRSHDDELRGKDAGAAKAAGQGGATPVYGTRALVGPDHDVEIVYALPRADDPPLADADADAGFFFGGAKKQVKIALLLHACTHSALKFFSPSPGTCDGCVGLSEELAIVREVLQRKYAVLAVTSADRKSGCWGGGGGKRSSDIDRVRYALDYFRHVVVSSSVAAAGKEEKKSDEKKAGEGGKGSRLLVDDADDGNDDASVGDSRRLDVVVVAIGASSGGRFAAVAAAEGLADGAIVMVSGLGDALWKRLASMAAMMPPIYLAPMVRDARTASAVRSDWKAMGGTMTKTMRTTTTTMMATTTPARERGKVVRSVAVPFFRQYLKGGVAPSSSQTSALLPPVPVVLDEDSCRPLPVTLEYLYQRVPNLPTHAPSRWHLPKEDTWTVTRDCSFRIRPNRIGGTSFGARAAATEAAKMEMVMAMALAMAMAMAMAMDAFGTSPSSRVKVPWQRRCTERGLFTNTA